MTHSPKVSTLFTTKWGFILACVGSAVGMANVWGFPYKFGQNGGGTFLIPYILFIVLFSYVGLSTEYALGRYAGTGTLGAYEAAWNTRLRQKPGESAPLEAKDKFFNRGLTLIGKGIGWLPLLGSLCIALGYAVIVSYVLKAMFDSLTGTLMHTDPGAWFENFSSHDYSVLPFHVIIVVATLLTTILGAKSIEKTNKIMMPLFFILFLLLAIRMAFLPGVLSGYAEMFRVDFSRLGEPMLWVWAMGQAFFSLSITGSGMIVYGAYLSHKEDVVAGARSTAFFDTLAAMVAVLVVIPACFAYSVPVTGGPGLLFVTLPKILQDIPGGIILAVVLYLSVCFGGITSLQNMFEAVIESLLHRFEKLSRTVATWVIGIGVLAIGIFIEPISKWGPWMDLVSIYIIPIGAVMGAVSWFWVMDKKILMQQINLGARKQRGQVWYQIGRYLYTPLALVLCLIALIEGISF